MFELPSELWRVTQEKRQTGDVLDVFRQEKFIDHRCEWSMDEFKLASTFI